jgi:hypothetical protein
MDFIDAVMGVLVMTIVLRMLRIAHASTPIR